MSNFCRETQGFRVSRGRETTPAVTTGRPGWREQGLTPPGVCRFVAPFGKRRESLLPALGIGTIPHNAAKCVDS